MKTLIYFNRPDCPENMGISQLTYNIRGIFKHYFKRIKQWDKQLNLLN